MRFNPVLPEFFVRDIGSSVRFYVDVLGFRSEYSREGGRFQFLSLGKAQLMLFQEGDHDSAAPDDWISGPLEYPRGRGFNLQIEVTALKPLLNALDRAGWPLFAPVTERVRELKGKQLREAEFLVQDPDGYLLRFSASV